jgi:LacI family transcriptional regulator
VPCRHHEHRSHAKWSARCPAASEHVSYSDSHWVPRALIRLWAPLWSVLPSHIYYTSVKGARERRRGKGTSGRATLSDVARKAGVSVMSVSNFVRGKSVRMRTRRRVEGAIARLNYRPNVSARSLRLAEVRSVGIVIADRDPAFLNDPFNSRLVSGLSNLLSSVDYTLDVQGSLPERLENATILHKLSNAALCAVLCGPTALRRAHLDSLVRVGIPVIVFQEVFHQPAQHVALVRQDDLSGGKELGEHLLTQRLRSVVFVRPALDWCAVEQREKGLRTVLTRAKRAIDVRTLVAASESFEDVQRTVRQYLAVRTPDAIVAATDSMAAAALKACEEAGLRVPRDLKVAGFNGFDVWRHTSPTLTTVVSPAYEMGRLAGELMVQKLASGTFPRRNFTLPVRLQIGESTE